MYQWNWPKTGSFTCECREADYSMHCDPSAHYCKIHVAQEMLLRSMITQSGAWTNAKLYHIARIEVLKEEWFVFCNQSAKGLATLVYYDNSKQCVDKWKATSHHLHRSFDSRTITNARTKCFQYFLHHTNRSLSFDFGDIQQKVDTETCSPHTLKIIQKPLLDNVVDSM